MRNAPLFGTLGNDLEYIWAAQLQARLRAYLRTTAGLKQRLPLQQGELTAVWQVNRSSKDSRGAAMKAIEEHARALYRSEQAFGLNMPPEPSMLTFRWLAGRMGTDLSSSFRRLALSRLPGQ